MLLKFRISTAVLFSLFCSYSFAEYKYECSSIYAENSLGWIPADFSFTVANGRVSQIKSDSYEYKKSQIRVGKVNDSVIKIGYNGIHKTTKGASIGTIHSIEIRPAEKRIWYRVTMTGYSNDYKGRGTCKKTEMKSSNKTEKKSTNTSSTCQFNVKKCTTKIVCIRATTRQHGGNHWQNNGKSSFFKYFVEAQRRGLSCDSATIFTGKPESVQKNTSDIDQTKDRTTLAYKKLNGYGVAKDLRGAFRLFLISAKQGDANAQNWLGKMYHQGNGAIKNYKKAYVWFNIAHANGYTTAGSRRDLVGQSMSSSDVSAAQDKSSSCIESDYVDC
jgi:hypothetical protein